MTDARIIYTELYNNFNENSFFDFSSSIFLHEFFMYLAIKSDKNNNKLCLPLLDVQNIFSKLAHESYDLLKDINNFLLKHNNNPVDFENIKYFYKEHEIELGQNNFINYMKEIFNHDYVSDIINKIKINVTICGIKVVMDIFNNDTIRDMKEEISSQLKINHNVLMNPNRIMLVYKKVILLDTNRIDFYNIQDNTTLESSIIMIYAPMI